MNEQGIDASDCFQDDRCPQCGKYTVPHLMGMDSKAGLYVRCSGCGWKTARWATQAMALTDWASAQQKRLEAKE